MWGPHPVTRRLGSSIHDFPTCSMCCSKHACPSLLFVWHLTKDCVQACSQACPVAHLPPAPFQKLYRLCPSAHHCVSSFPKMRTNPHFHFIPSAQSRQQSWQPSGLPTFEDTDGCQNQAHGDFPPGVRTKHTSSQVATKACALSPLAIKCPRSANQAVGQD